MVKLNKSSLARTVDSIHDDLFHDRKIPRDDKLKVARWITSRQGVERSYAGMYAPTPQDYKNGVRLYTGEKVTSGAGTGHILGEETCRALIALNVRDKAVAQALGRATDGISARLRQTTSPTGMY